MTQTRKRLEALETSVANLNDALRRRVQQEVFAICPQDSFTELASRRPRNSAWLANLLARLRALERGRAAMTLRNAIEADRHALLLRSAFALPQPQA